jgi:hypothetical protein
MGVERFGVKAKRCLMEIGFLDQKAFSPIPWLNTTGKRHVFLNVNGGRNRQNNNQSPHEMLTESET